MTASLDDALTRLLAGQDAASVPALLQLAALARASRGAQAPCAGAGGPLSEVDPAPNCATPLGERELRKLYQALTLHRQPKAAQRVRGPWSQQILAGALAGSKVWDLRLIGPFAEALADERLAGLIAEQILPRWGTAAIARVLAALNFQQAEGAARQLDYLARHGYPGAERLFRRAYEHGSPLLHVALIKPANRHFPGMAQEYVMRALLGTAYGT